MAFAYRQVCFVTGQTIQCDQMIHLRTYFKLFQCSFQFSVHSKPFKISQCMIFRIKVYAWRALAELRNTTRHMGDIKQAELRLKYLFYCQCSTLRIICWNSTAQEAAINLRVCRSPARLLQNIVLLKNGHVLSVLLHILLKAMGIWKENLRSWKKECFFSACVGIIKESVQAFSTKINTCREEKAVVIMALSQHTEILVEDNRAGTQIWVSVLQIILF